MRCSVCGRDMTSNTIGYECPVCGHKIDYSFDSTNTTSMREQTCPICGNKLEMTMEEGVTKSCSSCGYKVRTYTGDPPNYNQHTPGTNSLVNEPDNKPGGLYGWICPKCGRSLSPWTTECPCSVKWDLTCISSTGTSCNSHNITSDTKIPVVNRCNKCVYETTCSQDRDEEGKCTRFKRDAPDGGYYG